MFDTEQMLARFKWREIKDENGDPTDSGVIDTARVLQFVRPLHVQKKVDDGFEVRTEWMGYQQRGAGDDVFQIERKNMESIARRFVDDSFKHAEIRNVRPGDTI